MTSLPPDIVGFRVFGLYGELGVVIEVRRCAGDEAIPAIVVSGGLSSLLTYYVPGAWVRKVSRECGVVHVNADIANFIPRLNDDGTIELRPLRE